MEEQDKGRLSRSHPVTAFSRFRSRLFLQYGFKEPFQTRLKTGHKNPSHSLGVQVRCKFSSHYGILSELSRTGR